MVVWNFRFARTLHEADLTSPLGKQTVDVHEIGEDLVRLREPGHISGKRTFKELFGRVFIKLIPQQIGYNYVFQEYIFKYYM